MPPAPLRRQSSPLEGREEISFFGNICAGPNGDHGTFCTASFPGEYKKEWDRLVQRAEGGMLSTACVFLTQDRQGTHADNTEPGASGCWCHALYGEPKEWGCQWFEEWRVLVAKAHKRGQMVCVFYKEGHLVSVGAENTSWAPGASNLPGEVEWGYLASYTFEQLKQMPGLGASQKGEVAWLKKKAIPFMRMDVSKGVPDASATAQMLEARADGLRIDLARNLIEADDVAHKLQAVGALSVSLALRRDMVIAAETLSARVGAEGESATLTAKMNLASLLKEMGKRAEARTLYEEVISGRTQTLGADHPKTLLTKRNLAVLLADVGEKTRAVALYEEAIDGYTKQLGADHSDTLRAKMNLALLLVSDPGDRVEARTLYDDVISGLTRNLGSDHLDTLAAKNNLATVLIGMGEMAQAREIYEEVIGGYRARLGENHINTLRAKSNQGSLLRDLGEKQAARILLEEVVAASTPQLGQDHTETLRAKNNLAVLLAELGKRAEAQRLYEEVITSRTQQLGPDHEDTLRAKRNLANMLEGLEELSNPPWKASGAGGAEKSKAASTIEQLRAAFAVFDADGSGRLSEEEFKSVLTRDGVGMKNLSATDAAALFNLFDEDNVVSPFTPHHHPHPHPHTHPFVHPHPHPRPHRRPHPYLYPNLDSHSIAHPQHHSHPHAHPHSHPHPLFTLTFALALALALALTPIPLPTLIFILTRTLKDGTIDIEEFCVAMAMTASAAATAT